MNDTVVYLFILQAMHGGGCVHVYFYCIDFSYSLPNLRFIISRTTILMKKVLLPQSVIVGSHTHFFLFNYF